MNRPPSGTMVYWRGKGQLEWRFGYVTYVSGYNLIRMGPWAGANDRGPIVDSNEIEWKTYQ